MGAPVLVQSFTDSTGTPVFPSPTTAGNCIVWWWAMNVTGGGNQPTLSDSQGNSYSLLAASPSANNVRGFYVATGIVGGSLTGIFNTYGAQGLVCGMEFSGVTGLETSNPHAENTAGITSVSVGPITTTQANTRIVMGGGQGTGTLGTLTNSGSWTLINSGATSQCALALWSFAQGSPGNVSNTVNTSGTAGAANSFGGGLIGLKGSGLAPGSNFIVNPGMDGNMRPQLKGGLNG